MGEAESFAFKAGKYNAKKFCLEPTFLHCPRLKVASGKTRGASVESSLYHPTGVSSFLGPKGKTDGSTGYGQLAVAFGLLEAEEMRRKLLKENISKEHRHHQQPSDTDLGAKTPKDVKIQGIIDASWLGGVERSFGLLPFAPEFESSCDTSVIPRRCLTCLLGLQGVQWA
ncbi:hypothetical protein NC652_012449 [Populus alba x Populus x berolinensis]|nr:hypothetical protein NC652_012449 [Populus alba x Populus x berolinensis]